MIWFAPISDRDITYLILVPSLIDSLPWMRVHLCPPTRSAQCVGNRPTGTNPKRPPQPSFACHRPVTPIVTMSVTEQGHRGQAWTFVTRFRAERQRAIISKGTTYVSVQELSQ